MSRPKLIGGAGWWSRPKLVVSTGSRPKQGGGTGLSRWRVSDVLLVLFVLMLSIGATDIFELGGWRMWSGLDWPPVDLVVIETRMRAFVILRCRYCATLGAFASSEVFFDERRDLGDFFGRNFRTYMVRNNSTEAR
jgi:hypothetical protein